MVRLFPALCFLLAGLLLVISPVTAGGIGDRLGEIFGGSGSGDEILHPDQAFILTVDDSNPAQVHLHWDIAEGYYLYRDQFDVSTDSDTVAVGDLEIPPGEVEDDLEFGKVAVHRELVEIVVPLSRAGARPGEFELQVRYQGCKQDSVCYPPITRSFPMALAPIPTVQAATPSDGLAAPTAVAPSEAPASAQDTITDRLRDGGLLLNVLAFLGFGVLLSLTPCVFPMIPILSGIIVGHGRKVTALMGFSLSLAFVLAMALTYAIFGVIAGSFHFNLQAAAQNPTVIVAFSGVFVLLALSMFGFYQLQLPAAWQARLRQLSDRQHAGSLSGAAVMGALSAIIVGPCVAPPLAGALLYITQTGDALLGGLALFAMGLGFGVPLLVLGAAGGRLLPRAGPWMEVIKRVFGVLMLAVAIWFLERVFAGPFTLALWALLLVVSAIYMGALDSLPKEIGWQRLWKGTGLAMLAYGMVLVVAAAAGGHDPLRPLYGSQLSFTNQVAEQATEGLSFAEVETADELREALLQASLEARPVMFYFTAEWCVVCKELERYTYRDASVVRALRDFVLIKADVTANNAADRELLRRFELFGPPAILFFNHEARELGNLRLIGFIEAEDFVEHIKQIGKS